MYFLQSLRVNFKNLVLKPCMLVEKNSSNTKTHDILQVCGNTFTKMTRTNMIHGHFKLLRYN